MKIPIKFLKNFLFSKRGAFYSNGLIVNINEDIDIDENDLKDIEIENSHFFIVDSKQSLIKLIYTKHYEIIKKFNVNDEFVLITLFILFLTNFNPNALVLLRIYLYLINKNYHKKIESYIEANDTRGLLFYICKIFNLDFDYIKEHIAYIYFEPKINLKWMKKYHEFGMPINFWFYYNYLGKGLFSVLYTPKCRYKLEKGGCAGCNMPTVSSNSKIVDKEDIIQQIDYIFENLSLKEKSEIKEIIMSNNGSILDFKTMDFEGLKYYIKKSIDNLTTLKQITFETRIDEYSDFSKMKDLVSFKNNLKKDIDFELAVGFEIFDDNLRNGYYRKGIYKENIEKNLEKLKDLNVNLRIYMMYKPVPDNLMAIDEAIEDINNASKYFAGLSEKNNTNIILHISPTYLATGTQLYRDYKKGLYTPLKLDDIERLYNELKIYDNLKYYISLNNEGLGVDYFDEDNYQKFLNLKEKIEYFNVYDKKNKTYFYV